MIPDESRPNYFGVVFHRRPSRYRGSLPEPDYRNCDFDCYSYNYGGIIHNMQNHREEMHINRIIWSLFRNHGRAIPRYE